MHITMPLGGIVDLEKEVIKLDERIGKAKMEITGRARRKPHPHSRLIANTYILHTSIVTNKSRNKIRQIVSTPSVSYLSRNT